MPPPSPLGEGGREEGGRFVQETFETVPKIIEEGVIGHRSKDPLQAITFRKRKGMPLIYHIAEEGDWKKAQESGEYRSPSLGRFGFIHCSTREQIIKVANFQYKGAEGKVLLEIDEELLNERVEYEKVPGAPFDEAFPHVYGAIESNAVVGWAEFEPHADGSFEFPEDLEG